MKFFRTKLWAPLDLGCLKWASILFGMIAGAYLSSFVKDYLWVFIAAIVLLTIRPLYVYWIRQD